MKPFTAYLSEQQRAKLDRLIDKTGIKLAEHIRRAVDAYLKAEGIE